MNRSSRLLASGPSARAAALRTVPVPGSFACGVGRTCRARRACLLALAATLLAGFPRATRAADWPQFGRSAAHTADAADESLTFPLGLATRVQLQDAVLSSPAVVGDRVYVVDQMATAYAVDPRGNRIVWKSSPDGDAARGANTSSPCVAAGRVFFGSTSGRLHILDAASGSRVKSIDLGWPITGSPTWCNETVYLQSVGGVLHAFDRDGNERWRYEHHREYAYPQADKLKGQFPGGFNTPHFGGGEVAVFEKRVVSHVGWDLFCLEDFGKSPKLLWCNRAAYGKDGGVPMGPAIADGFIFCGHPGTDRVGGMIRARLADGETIEKRDHLHGDYTGFGWAVFGTPAVRGATAIVPTHYMGVFSCEFGDRPSRHWVARTDNTYDQRTFTPCLGTPALTKEHCAFGTLFGDLFVVAIKSQGAWPNFKPEPFRFRVPSGKPIAGSPVVAGGAVYFGCDDGCLYGLTPNGDLPLPQATAFPDLSKPRTKAAPATGKPYTVPVASMDQGNTGFVDDPRLVPPFRLRYALRPGDTRSQINADEDSFYTIAEAGTLAAWEQATGRLRWRRRLLGTGDDGWKQMLLDRGRLFITRASPNAHPERDGGAFSAIDARSGETIWSVPWGAPLQGTCRAAPLAVGEVVAAIHRDADGIVTAKAFDAATGKPRWSVEIPGDKKGIAAGGCVLDGVMYFSRGQTWGNGAGSTLAVEPASGKVLWTNSDHHVHGYGRPAARDGRLYLGGQAGAPFYCLSARDGSLLWKADRISYQHSPALGDNFFVVRGYSGHGLMQDLKDGSTMRRKGHEALAGAPDHACAPVLLTSGRISFAASSSGLYARNLDSGEIVWNSLGFAPRACTTPIAANGRLLYSPNVNNLLFCWEPVPRE